MRTAKHFVLAAAIIILLAGFFAAYIVSLSQKITSAEIITPSGTISVNVEVADEPLEWQHGLMFRESLPENSGMLFIFPDEQPRRFWMKNTLIPLDIIFVSSNLTIVGMKENFPPCLNDPCEAYTSKPAKYAIEVNAGFVERNDIKINDKISVRSDNFYSK